MPLQRYHSAEVLHHYRPPGRDDSYLIQRSRSYSPAVIPQRPAFSTVKSLCPSESLFYVSHDTFPDKRCDLYRPGCTRDTRYSNTRHVVYSSRKPAGSLISCPSPTGSSRVSERSANNGRYNISPTGSHRPRRRISSPVRKYSRNSSPFYVNDRSVSPAFHGNRHHGSGDRVLSSILYSGLNEPGIRREKEKALRAERCASRSTSPAELLVKRYKEGGEITLDGRAPDQLSDVNRRTSFNGVSPAAENPTKWNL